MVLEHLADLQGPTVDADQQLLVDARDLVSDGHREHDGRVSPSSASNEQDTRRRITYLRTPATHAACVVPGTPHERPVELKLARRSRTAEGLP